MNLEDLLKKNASLRNIHAGKRCFIIGNGPSIRTQDLTPLRDEVTLVVSSFFRHPEARSIRPRYWLLADPLFWNKPEEFFSPLFNTAMKQAVDVKLFVPTGGAKFFTKVNTGPLIDLHFFHYDPSKDIRSAIDFTGGIPQFGQNVVIVALMLALYLGCNPIYFIGCDHDFMKTEKEDYESLSVQHFYANTTRYKASERLTWDQWQAAMARMNYEYEHLKRYAGLRGFEVYNATRGGCFDNFPRIEFESLFAPALDLLKVGIAPDARSRRDALHLGTAAVALMNNGDHESAHTLVNEAMRCNINAPRRVEGLHYLKALCLAKSGSYGEALVSARSDYAGNPANREKSESLIRQLEARI